MGEGTPRGGMVPGGPETAHPEAPVAGPPDAAPWLAQVAASRTLSFLSAAGLVAAALLPPGGLGLPLCQFRVWTGLPCPGCGLTRSLIGVGHLDLDRAWTFHPLGPLLAVGMLLSAALLVVGERRRERVVRILMLRPGLSRIAAWSLGGSLAAYGTLRLAWLMVNPGPAPW